MLLLEPPAGALTRRTGPYGTGPRAEVSAPHLYLDAGKESAFLDLAGPDGPARIASLVPHFDVVLHSFAPAEAARLDRSHGGAVIGSRCRRSLARYA